MVQSVAAWQNDRRLQISQWNFAGNFAFSSRLMHTRVKFASFTGARGQGRAADISAARSGRRRPLRAVGHARARAGRLCRHVCGGGDLRWEAHDVCFDRAKHVKNVSLDTWLFVSRPSPFSRICTPSSGFTPHADARFSADADARTVFRTRNIVAVPIKMRDGEETVIGVLQCVNKNGGAAFSEAVDVYVFLLLFCLELSAVDFFLSRRVGFLHLRV